MILSLADTLIQRQEIAQDKDKMMKSLSASLAFHPQGNLIAPTFFRVEKHLTRFKLFKFYPCHHENI